MPAGRGRLAAAVVVALLLTGCTSGSGSEPSPTATTRATGPKGPASSSALPEPTPSTFPALVATAGPPVVSATGKIEGVRPAEPVTLGVLSVTATKTSTTLAYTVSSASRLSVVGGYPLNSGTEGIQLLAASAGQRLRPLWLTVDAISSTCICSLTPKTLGPEPVFQSIAFPPLPDAVTDVQVLFPGLEPVTVAVARP